MKEKVYDIFLGFKNYPIPVRLRSMDNFYNAFEWLYGLFSDYDFSTSDIDRISFVEREVHE